MATDSSEEGQWRDAAKGMLKAELKRQNLTYEQLAERLRKAGSDESEVSIRNKLARGTFTFAFALQAFSAMGLELVVRRTELPKRGMAVELDPALLEKFAEMVKHHDASAASEPDD